MFGFKLLFLIGSLLASSHAFWWGRDSESSSSNQVNQVTAAPPSRQFPVSYIRAFAYHPVAFPQPLAPITTYHVSRNPQTFANRNFPAGGVNMNSFAQALQQQLLQSQDQMGMQMPVMAQPPTQQQLPQNAQVDFGPPPTTTSTTTTTTTTPAPAPVPTQPQFSQPIPPIMTRSGFSEGYQRQIPFQQQMYQAGNFGGFPQFPAPPMKQFQYNEQFQYDQPNQFSGRLFGAEPSYQQYAADPVTYQFIPTSITQIPNQNNIKFVPCMCPVAVSISPPIPEKRTDEIPILSATTESEVSSPSTQQTVEESK